MEESNQQSTNSQQSSTNPRLAHQKVLQPDATFVAEMKTSQQPVASPSHTKPVVTAGLQTPAAPSIPVNEAKVAGATESQIPVGMSASQMGFNQSQRDTNLKSFLKPVLIVVVVLIVLGAGLLIYKSLSGYGTRTVQGDGFTYTITYNKMSSGVSLNGKSYLQGSDKSGHAMLMYVGKSVHSTFDCHTSVGSTISIIATPTIEGKQHNLCYSQSLNAYDMNFTHNGIWYYLSISPKDNSQTLDQDTVIMIASSVRISQ